MIDTEMDRGSYCFRIIGLVIYLKFFVLWLKGVGWLSIGFILIIFKFDMGLYFLYDFI